MFRLHLLVILTNNPSAILTPSALMVTAASTLRLLMSDLGFNELSHRLEEDSTTQIQRAGGVINLHLYKPQDMVLQYSRKVSLEFI